MNYYIFTLGCQYNYYDATRIAHLLEKMGYVLSKENNADLIIILACSVRQKGVDRIFGKIRNWQKLSQKPRIIITACLLENDKRKLADKVEAIVDSKDIIKWLNCHIVHPERSRRTELSKKQYNHSTTLPRGYSLEDTRDKSGQVGVNDITIEQYNNEHLPLGESKNTAYIPIMQGCNNFCSFCAVPYTRGREMSRNEKEIIDEIQNELKKGFKKILLLGQNVNSYGLSPKVTSNKPRVTSKKLQFAKLLEKIDQIEGDFTYNFMSSNPHDFTDDLINTLSKLTKWEKVLHLPLQSGDHEILKKMNRKYNSAQYLSLISKIKNQISKIKLTTDIIVGFPGETRAQFLNTVKLCQKIGFSKAYVSQYSPRPQTVSAKTMEDDVPKNEKKRRWTILNNLINKKST